MMVLDTNIVILYLKDDAEITKWMERNLLAGLHFALSTMTVVELLGFTEITAEEIFLIEQLLESVLVVDVDLSIAREAARIRRKLKLTTIDSTIAATAVILDASLVTHDVAFKKIRDVKVIAP